MKNTYQRDMVLFIFTIHTFSSFPFTSNASDPHEAAGCRPQRWGPDDLWHGRGRLRRVWAGGCAGIRPPSPSHPVFGFSGSHPIICTRFLHYALHYIPLYYILKYNHALSKYISKQTRNLLANSPVFIIYFGCR